MKDSFVTGLIPRVILGAVASALLFGSAVEARPIMASAARELGIYPSPYANYLVGRFAMAQGDVSTASAALGAASAGDPQNADLRQKAFLVAVLDGRIDDAQGLAQGFSAPAEGPQMMVHTLNAVTAIKAGHASAATRDVAELLKLDSGDRTGLLLRPYVLAMDGQVKAALDDSGDAVLARDDNNRLVIYFLKAERARIQEIKGHNTEAEAIYKALYQPGAAAFIFGPDYAMFLERQGRKDEARAIWQTLADKGHDANAALALTRLDAAGYTKPALPTLGESVAQALFLSSTLYYSDHATELALANLRLALYLDPSSDRQRIFLGQIEQDLKDPEAAEAAWASVPQGSPLYSEASLRRIWSLRGRNHDDDALKLVDEALNASPDNLGYTIEKANILQSRDDNAGALKIINDRIARAGDKDFTWQAWFLQAMLYDGLDQWDNAEVAIKKAQAIDPNRPEIMNFLGYGWINRGLHVDQGMDLVRQALAIDPKSGAIVDSLGWGYYKMGDYANALNYVEQAVQMAPSDAEINDHLGDVYKALGRDVEAGYEWQRAVSLDVSPSEAASIRQKIDANDQTLKVKGLVAPTAGASKTEADAVPLVRHRRGGFGRA